MRTPAGALVALGAVLALGACGGSGGGVHHAATAARLRAHAGGGHVPALADSARFASDHALPATGIASASTSGRITSYIGFDPSRDGFAFQNYGFVAGADVDVRALRELFGDVVCATAASDTCTLTPAAAQWEQSAEGQLYGGHCFGFSTTALRFFRHDPSPSAFGAATTYGLPFSRALQSEIAADFMTQFLAPVQQSSRPVTPSQIIPFLQQAFAGANHGGELYTLGIYSTVSGEGHAITPIGLEDLGGGRWSILVYDNNKPNTVQGVRVDTQADTWSYLVAINPQQHDAVWSGQGTSNRMVLMPLSATTGRQPCPFCQGTGATAPMTTISLAGDPTRHAHLLITVRGRRLGWVAGHLVNEIPGARIIRPLVSDVTRAHPEPVYQLPAADHATVAVLAGSPAGAIPTSVSVIGPGYGERVTGLAPGPASGARIVVGPGGSGLSVRLTGRSAAAAPTVAVARDQGRGGHTLIATPAALHPGSALSVSVRAGAGRVALAGAPTPVAIGLTGVDARGTRTIARRSTGTGTRSLSLGLVRIG